MSRCAPVTSGPISERPSLPAPTVSLATRSLILATSSSPTGSTATTTEIAMQRSPAEPNPAETAASAARSRSASGSTTMWFFAPPSACTRLPCAGAGLVDVAGDRRGADEARPPSTSGCSSSASTATLSPCTTLNTPSGSPASRPQLGEQDSDADGSFSDGLSTKALPQAIATGNIHIGTMAGKLNGVIPADHAERLRGSSSASTRGGDVLGEPALEQVRDAAGELDDLQAARRPRPARRTRTLPCSAVISAASSSRLRARPARGRRTGPCARLAREVSRQAGAGRLRGGHGVVDVGRRWRSRRAPVTSPVAGS